jgi:hypothetical protein
MEKLYRVEEFYTDGWHTIDATCAKLTKEQASAKLEQWLNEGIPPYRLRAVPDNDN